MAIEIVDFPIKNDDVPWHFVCSPEGILLGVNHWAAGGRLDSAAPRLEHSDGHSFPSAQPRAGEIYQRVICRMRHATVRHGLGANVMAVPVRDVTLKGGKTFI